MQPEELYDKAMALYGAGERAYAADLLASAAENGVAEAAYQLGLMYELGDGVEADMSACCRWFSLAARLGSAEAQTRVAALSLLGYAQGEDADALLRSAARHGSAIAKGYLEDE